VTLVPGHTVVLAKPVTVVFWFTVTLNAHVFVFPDASYASQVTTVMPTAKSEPDAGVHATVGALSQESIAVALKVTMAEFELVHAIMFPGHVIIGGVVSITINVTVSLVVAPT